MYMLIRTYTAIRSRNVGKYPTAFLILAKSAFTRKFRKAQTIVPNAMALGNPPYALLRTFQSPIPARTVHATAMNVTNSGIFFFVSRMLSNSAP